MKTGELIRKARFEQLFRDHFTGLCFFARKYTGDLESARDIVHQVFIRVWENRDTFDWEKPAKAYLFSAVYKRSLNHLRDNRKFEHGRNPESNDWVPDTAGYDNLLETAELEAAINCALHKLPAKCREIFEKSRYEGKKYREIAEELQLSVKTVESHMSKALSLLREDLKAYLSVLLIFLMKNQPPL